MKDTVAEMARTCHILHTSAPASQCHRLYSMLFWWTAEHLCIVFINLRLNSAKDIQVLAVGQYEFDSQLMVLPQS